MTRHTHPQKGNDDPTHHHPKTQKISGHRVNDVPRLHTTAAWDARTPGPINSAPTIAAGMCTVPC